MFFFSFQYPDLVNNDTPFAKKLMQELNQAKCKLNQTACLFLGI